MAFVLHLPIVIVIVAGGIWFLFIVYSRLNIFASKISDLLLPLGAEGAVGSQSYHPMIWSINISMMLFNDLFIYFVVVVFPFFGTSKELIRDSQRL